MKDHQGWFKLTIEPGLTSYRYNHEREYNVFINTLSFFSACQSHNPKTRYLEGTTFVTGGVTFGQTLDPTNNNSISILYDGKDQYIEWMTYWNSFRWITGIGCPVIVP